jgi:hypothetical protein
VQSSRLTVCCCGYCRLWPPEATEVVRFIQYGREVFLLIFRQLGLSPNSVKLSKFSSGWEVTYSFSHLLTRIQPSTPFFSVVS